MIFDRSGLKTIEAENGHPSDLLSNVQPKAFIYWLIDLLQCSPTGYTALTHLGNEINFEIILETFIIFPGGFCHIYRPTGTELFQVLYWN